MKNIGWMVAMVVAAGALYWGLEARGLRHEVLDIGEGLRATEASLAQVTKELEDLQNAYDKLAGEHRALLQASGSPSAPPEPVQVAAVEEVADPADEEEPEDEDSARRERVVNAQLGMIGDIAYRPFYDELDLPQETRDALRPLVAEAMNRSRLASEKAMREGNVPVREIKRIEDEADAWLAEEVAGILTPEQVAGWDAYQDYAEQILYEYLLDGQLTMLSQGLTPENRKVVKEVFAEELKVAIDGFKDSDAMFTLGGYNEAQMDGLRQGLERLGPGMDMLQYKEAAGFVNQAGAMFEAMGE